MDQNIVTMIESDIRKRETELEALCQALHTIKSASDGSLPSPVTPTQFASSRSLGDAAREYLTQKGSPATIDEIREVLIAGGAAVGQYPKRSVKLAIVNNPRVFEIKNGLVYLRRA